MNKKQIIFVFMLVFAALCSVFAQSGENAAEATDADLVPVDETVAAVEQIDAAAGDTAAEKNTSMIKYIAAALAVGLACLAGGMAVGKIGAAAMGAMSENSELSGKALPFVGLAEGICLWGFLVALLIIIL